MLELRGRARAQRRRDEGVAQQLGDLVRLGLGLGLGLGVAVAVGVG